MYDDVRMIIHDYVFFRYYDALKHLKTYHKDRNCSIYRRNARSTCESGTWVPALLP